MVLRPEQHLRQRVASKAEVCASPFNAGRRRGFSALSSPLAASRRIRRRARSAPEPLRCTRRSSALGVSVGRERRSRPGSGHRRPSSATDRFGRMEAGPLPLGRENARASSRISPSKLARVSSPVLTSRAAAPISSLPSSESSASAGSGKFPAISPGARPAANRSTASAADALRACPQRRRRPACRSSPARRPA